MAPSHYEERVTAAIPTLSSHRDDPIAALVTLQDLRDDVATNISTGLEQHFFLTQRLVVAIALMRSAT